MKVSAGVSKRFVKQPTKLPLCRSADVASYIDRVRTAMKQLVNTPWPHDTAAIVASHYGGSDDAKALLHVPDWVLPSTRTTSGAAPKKANKKPLVPAPPPTVRSDLLSWLLRAPKEAAALGLCRRLRCPRPRVPAAAEL